MLGFLGVVLAIVALVQFSRVMFSRRSPEPRAVVVAILLVVLATMLGSAWVVHPAAGMLLGFVGSQGFRRGPWRRPALVLGVMLALGLSVLGASWVLYPMVFMVAMALMTGAGRRGSSKAERRQFREQRQALTAEAGGERFQPPASAGAVPVMAQAERASPAQRPATAPLDPVQALGQDSRLPGDVRARLVALDLRTREALTYLHNNGQVSSEAAYLARAIREEYAPTAVQAYLKLPRSQAETAPLTGGRTGGELLREQLDLLLSAVQDLLGGALKASGQELLAHQRFLEERFGRGGGDLKV
ncbi:hypothetical protein [Deinococcus navajonensis]|uniref:MFS transporter n=1 Tax=Deinococcus navajonensis TaxID=309884 RepID=A0ABV8XLE3_9DEIO